MKTKFLMILFMAAGIGIGSMTSANIAKPKVVEADNSSGAKMKLVKLGIYFDTYEDTETGVEYIIYHADKRGGITVRYDSDGEVYVSKKGDK